MSKLITIPEELRNAIVEENKHLRTQLSEVEAGYQARIAELERFAHDCFTGFDCDSDAHKYGTQCRACDAEALLLANKSPTKALDQVKLNLIGSIKPHWDEKNQMFVAHYEDIAKMADEIKTRLNHDENI